MYRFDTPLLVLYYAVLFGATCIDWRTWQAELKLRPAVALGLTAVVGLWGWNLALTAPDGRAHIPFLDAGSAATLVRAPPRLAVLFAGGTKRHIRSIYAKLGREHRLISLMYCLDRRKHSLFRQSLPPSVVFDGDDDRHRATKTLDTKTLDYESPR